MYKRIVNESVVAKDKVFYLSAAKNLSFIEKLKKATKENGMLLNFIAIPENLEKLPESIMHSGYIPDIFLIEASTTEQNLRILRLIKRNVKLNHASLVVLGESENKTKDVITFLNSGADEFLTRPLSMEYLLAKMNALLRRARIDKKPEEVLKFKSLVLYPTSHIAKIGDKSINLTPKEFALLYFLVKRKGEALSRKILLENVWQHSWTGDPRTLNKHIETLRKKLGSKLGSCIEAVPGVGYKLSSR